MKKLLIITVMGLLMLSLTGCFFGLIIFPVNEQQATDKMAERIIDALDTNMAQRTTVLASITEVGIASLQNDLVVC
jgi:hypothetical protein